MRRIRYKRKHDPLRHRKTFCIRECNEDKQCRTEVLKRFLYQARPVEERTPPQAPQPQIFVKKTFDSKKQEESYRFIMKGAFFVTQGRFVRRIDFRHVLIIHIVWKGAHSSPQTSVTLT